MPSDPRVVALVPAWNASAFIGRTLEALAAQTYTRLEVLVSVDVSTDDTEAVCRAWAHRDSRIRVFGQRSRQGFVGNTGALLREAHADYAFWAWHDDLVHPDYVRRLVPVMESAPDVASAFTDLELHGFDGRVETLAYTRLEGLTDPVERARRVLRMPQNWWIPNRGLFRLEHARRIGGFRRHRGGDYKADWPWAVSMALLGEHIRVPAVLCRKFMKDTSLSASWCRDWRANAGVTLSCAKTILQSDLPPLDRARTLAAIAGAAKDFAARRFRARGRSTTAAAYRRHADADRSAALHGDRW